MGKKILGSIIIAIPFGALLGLLVTIIVNILRFGAIKFDDYFTYFIVTTILLIIVSTAFIGKVNDQK